MPRTILLLVSLMAAPTIAACSNAPPPGEGVTAR
jgi:hypothetical protein